MTEHLANDDSKNGREHHIRYMTTVLIDYVHNQSLIIGTDSAKRHASIAIDFYEKAAVWAIKSLRGD